MTTTEEYILQHRTDDVNALALRLHARPELDAHYVLRQVEGWQRLRHKVPAWTAVEGIQYPPRLALEQCSSETTACYKQRLVSRLVAGVPDATMADLTGGMGVDFSFMARACAGATYVEQQPDLVDAARHNFPLLGLSHATVIEGDGTAHLRQMDPVTLLYLDPARRDGAGRKTVRIEDCRPDVAQLLPLLKSKARVVILKLSPMLDAVSAVKTLGGATELHVVSDGHECKELLLVLTARDTAEPRIICAEGDRTFSFTRQEEAEARPRMADTVERYLYEPGPAVMKAGAYRRLATVYDLEKLHPNSHLYTSARLLDDFPGRRFEILRTAGFGKAEMRGFIGDNAHANIAVRNFPMTVDALRRKLRVKDGGAEYWFATTMADGAHRLIACRKIL